MEQRTPKVYRLRVHPDWAVRVDQSLQEGEARFGWSYEKHADLRWLQEQIANDQRSSLSPQQIDCYQRFLLDISIGDWLIYVNVPSHGQCVAARVSKPYFFRFDDRDFNHRLGVETASILRFDRNDAHVSPSLSNSLKKPRRWAKVSAMGDFFKLLEMGPKGRAMVEDDRIKLFRERADSHLREITGFAHETHPGKDLEELIVHVINNIPGASAERKQGLSDKGADIVVNYERQHVLTGELVEEMAVVQIKSYGGIHDSRRAIHDVERAFDQYPDATEGIIISTAEAPTDEFLDELDTLRSTTGKPVYFISGADVAVVLLRLGWGRSLS